MGLVDSFSSASTMAKVSLILILVAFLLNWIAFTTTSWGVVDDATDRHVGLWRNCQGGCQPLDGYAKEWLGAVQAFAIFGFMGINVACLLIVLYIFWDSCKMNREVGMAAAIICIVTAVMYLIAVIVFGAEWSDDDDISSSLDDDDDELGFSFGLAIVALILEGITGALMLVASKGA